MVLGYLIPTVLFGKMDYKCIIFKFDLIKKISITEIGPNEKKKGTPILKLAMVKYSSKFNKKFVKKKLSEKKS